MSSELISDGWVLIFIVLVLQDVFDFLSVSLVDLRDGTLKVLRMRRLVDARLFNCYLAGCVFQQHLFYIYFLLFIIRDIIIIGVG